VAERRDAHLHAQLPARRQSEGADAHQPRSSRLGASQTQRQVLDRARRPCIRGWITYYRHFYKTQLRPTLKRIDAYVIKWARRKFKRMRHQTKGARDWFDRFRRANPKLLAHWSLCHGNGRINGSRMNREVHVRFWESPEVKVLRATRQNRS
jgi:hypothetical protein